MGNIINHCSQFIAKPIGPIHACIKDKYLKEFLPLDFLNSYIVDNSTDAELLKELCLQHNEIVPDRIVYSFSEKRYNDLSKDPKANLSMIATLNEENPIIANILVDHLNIHILGVHLGS